MLGDKNATYLCSKIISTLHAGVGKGVKGRPNNLANCFSKLFRVLGIYNFADRMFYNSKNVSQELTEAIIKSEREVTRTSVIVVLSFILLYMPYIIDGAFINRDFHKNGNHPGIRIVVYMIFWSSTFVNTCIYVCSNRLYDSAFFQTYGFSPSCMKHEPDQKSLRLKTLKISKNSRSR